MKLNKKTIFFCIFVIFIVIFIGLKFQSYFSSTIPLWYDHGIYRAFFMMLQNQLPYLDLWQLPIWVKSIYEPFSGILYITTQSILWISVDSFLLRWVVAIHSILAFFIYILLRKYNQKTALIGILLYTTSVIQYQVFWRWYIKQMIGVIFLLTAYYLFEKKKYRLLLPILAGLFTVNRPGALFFVISFVVYKIVQYITSKIWTWKDIYPIIIGWILALIIYWPILYQQIFSMFGPMFGQIFIWDQSGTFFDKSSYFIHNTIIIIFSIFWCIIWYQKNIQRKLPMELIWFSVGILRVWLQLFFYNRMLGYLDIFVIIFAAYGLSYLISLGNKVWKYIAIWIYILQILFFVWYAGGTNFPLIVEKEFESIKQIPSLIQSWDKIMVTDKKYSAFLMWYANYNIIARWLFDLDPRTTKQWEYWHLVDGKTKCILLNTLPQEKKPNYLWIWSLQKATDLSWANCLQKKLWDKRYWFYLVNYSNE